MATKRAPSLGLNFARIAQQMQRHREFISEKKMKVISPGGFPYESFNGRARIHPWSLLRMVEYSRATCFNKFQDDDACFMDFDKIYQNYLMFIMATKTEISPSLYDFTVPKGPVETMVELVNVGKSSYNLKSSMFLPGVREPVCVNYCQTVFVDLEGRKPSSPPDWWRDKYGSGPEGSGTPLKLERHIVPEDRNSLLTPYQFKIKASDIDTYLHTNWIQYLRFSYDAVVNHVANEAAGTSDRSHIMDMVFRRYKSFSLLYLREANLLDTIDTRLWNCPNNEDIYKMQFCRGSDILSESTVELYPHIND